MTYTGIAYYPFTNTTVRDAYKINAALTGLASCIAEGAGATGDQGDTGAQGETGSGIDGATGLQGETGSQGETGTGVQGETGLQGDTGSQGETGSQGDQGDTGLQGSKGDTGSQGDTGVAGVQGDQGDTGLQGSKGDTGLQGETGVDGLRGDTGMGGTIAEYSYQFFSDQLDYPFSSDWAITDYAVMGADTLNPALFVRNFDDTLEEGVGFSLELPPEKSNLRISIRARAVTPPFPMFPWGVVLKLYNRDIPDNAAVGSWSAGVTLTTLLVTPIHTYFQYYSQTLTYATLGLTAGTVTQFQLTRNGADGNDTLIGDWALLEVLIQLS